MDRFNYTHRTLSYICNFGSDLFFNSLFLSAFEFFDRSHINFSNFRCLFSNYSRFQNLNVFNSLFSFYFRDNDRLYSDRFKHFHELICDDKILKVHYFKLEIVALRFNIAGTLYIFNF